MTDKKVISAGHICCDITPVIPKQGKMDIAELLHPGKLLNVENAVITTGGSVNSTGLTMKLLGVDVTLAGKVGEDAFGDIVARSLREHDAEQGLIRKAGENTSYSVIIAIPDIDRIILHHPGANDTFCADDLPAEKLAGTTLFHFGYPPLMRRMYSNDGAELLRMLQTVKEAGCATSLDMAMADPNSEAGKVNWKYIIEQTLPCIDFFVPSLEELLFMLDKEKFFTMREAAAGRDLCEVLDLERDIRPLGQTCMELGAKILLIKCGAAGMYLRTASAELLGEISPRLELDVKAWEMRDQFEKSYKPSAIRSGTGAGDTSIAAFLTSVLDGYGPDRALQFATATGALCVSDYTIHGSVKPLAELEKLIDAGWEKNP